MFLYLRKLVPPFRNSEYTISGGKCQISNCSSERTQKLDTEFLKFQVQVQIAGFK